MQRRDLIRLFGGMAASWPLVARAQLSAMPVIGLLSSAGSKDYAPMIAAFLKSLGEAGFIEGQNVSIEYMWADDQYERLPGLAAELVRRQVNVIVAAATPAAVAAKPATKMIPIVFAIGGDPVRTGLVDSLSRPGGNLTGAAHINVEIVPKRLELLHELMSAEKVIGLLVNKTNPVTETVVADVQTAAASLGLEARVIHARNDEDIEAAFSSLPRMQVRALVIGTAPFFTSRSEKLGAMSLRLAIPAIYQYRAFVEAGGVMSYGGSITELTAMLVGTSDASSREKSPAICQCNFPRNWSCF